VCFAKDAIAGEYSQNNIWNLKAVYVKLVAGENNIPQIGQFNIPWIAFKGIPVDEPKATVLEHKTDFPQMVMYPIPGIRRIYNPPGGNEYQKEDVKKQKEEEIQPSTEQFYPLEHTADQTERFN
jgi:hypothetical protein